MVDQAVEVIRKRVDKMGTSEPIITPSGTDRILVQIPGLSAEKLNETRAQLQQVAKLEFRMVHPNSDAIIPGRRRLTPPTRSRPTRTSGTVSLSRSRSS